MLDDSRFAVPTTVAGYVDVAAGKALKGPVDLKLDGSNNAGQITSRGGTMPIESGVFIHGSGAIRANELANSGRIVADKGTLNIQAVDITNTGSLEATSGSTLWINGSGTFDSQGVISIVPGATVKVSTAGAVDNQGAITVGPGGTLNFATARTNNHGTISILSLAPSAVTTTTSFVAESGSHLVFATNPLRSGPALVVSGNLYLTAADDWLDLIPSGQPHTEPLISFTGSGSGSFDHVTPGFVVNYSGQTIWVTEIPEPTLMMAWSLSILMGRGIRRR